MLSPRPFDYRLWVLEKRLYLEVSTARLVSLSLKLSPRAGSCQMVIKHFFE